MPAPKSLESVLDEERRDVLALLEAPEGRPRCSASSTASRRTSSSATRTPQSPVRSMLDIGEDEKPRHASIGGTASRGISFATPPTPIRSMLDITSPPPTRGTHSAQASPTEATHRVQMADSVAKTRSHSDASSRPADFGPRAIEKTSRYQFSNFLTNNPGGPILPKRNTQGGMNFPSAMASVVSGVGVDLSSLMGRGRGRNNSIASTGMSTNHAKSKSPHNRFSLRSSSPSLIKNKVELDDGRVIDAKSAYRRLSDANLALSGGSLSELSEKGRKGRTESGSTNGSSRIEKEYASVDTEDAVAYSSDEDNESSDEDGPRGRRSRENSMENNGPESQTIGMGRGKGPRQALSLMAAAEEERQEVAAQQPYKVRSLLEPEITVTSPGGDRPKSARHGVHPQSSFDDYQNSGLNTPVDSDAEENLTDIKRAQKLSINMTEVISTPATKRCVRTLYRGDFPKMQQEAFDDIRRVRKYLVATDLSPESQHALEWTIGTVLRDGDTLLAIYCVDEKKEITQAEEVEDAQMKAQAEAVAAQATKASGSTPVLKACAGPGPLGSNTKLGLSSASASPVGRERSKMEQERFRFVQNITERVSRLLRKTKLQVRVVIEVIHCKSAMHLITEVIDYVSPTLVILGCRGRSALKSSLLGSFSNYLVTKSSAPVMVARKKLRKHAKAKRPKVRLVNNLANPVVRSLTDARID